MTELDYFQELAAKVVDVKPGKMFGAHCLKTPNGKAAVMLSSQGKLVAKLTDDFRNEAMALDGVRLFEPMEGHQMKEWIEIPIEYRDKWLNFMLDSVENVRQMKPNAKKKK